MSMETPPKKPQKKVSQIKIKPSIRRDAINPRDYNSYKLPWTCDDCTHFASATATCTLGYKTEAHRRETFNKTYERSGTVALCRFIEID